MTLTDSLTTQRERAQSLSAFCIIGTIIFRAIDVIETDTFAWMMCGISGIWKGTDLAAGGQRISDMVETIVHRGPDRDGRLVRPGLAMGMRRLAIIDVAGGDQPIYNEEPLVAFLKDLRPDDCRPSRGWRKGGPR